MKRQGAIGAAAWGDIVVDLRPVVGMRARPVPAAESMFERFFAPIAVEIRVAGPVECAAIETDINTRARRNRPPMVPLSSVEREGLGVDRLGSQRDCAAHARGQRRCPFIDLKLQSVAVPVHAAWADCDAAMRSRKVAATALGHRPAIASGAVERDIHRAMIFRIAPTRPRVVRREHAADEGDDGQAVLFVIAECVDVPPGVTAAGRDRRVEARSAKMLCAACWPESAAIGTPAPGCTPPPAR